MATSYPHITEAEFDEACKAFIAKSRRTQQTHSFHPFQKGGTLCIWQTRRIGTHEVSVVDQSEYQPEDSQLDEDEETLIRSNPESEVRIEFSVVLSPVYQVPVLWFTAYLLPEKRPLTLDKVYQYIISESSHTLLHDVGVLGGISFANHPRSGIPAFFIHPCRTSEILNRLRTAVDTTPIDYLLIWFGVIGPCVGIYVPPGVVLAVA